MPRTDVTTPDYYHRVVDCQWACPAHTPVPEYIRLIEQGRYADAYMLNRESNVFPGILGRVCDRPCEPACRRGRVEEKPIAICRLKRVAADLKGDIADRLPKIPKQKLKHKIALIGAGPASLTVANDLLPLGYQVTLFEKEAKLGGAMRASVPSFRLPEKVLDEEIDMILDMGVELRAGSPVTSLKTLLASKEFAAVFVGTGAPLGRDLNIEGRKEGEKNIFVGLDWLANVAFDHVDKIGKRVIVVGGGNTAMDCCRTAKRLGGKEVKVIAPESYEQMLASPWEKEDAESEQIEIINHLLPKRFVVKNNRLVGVEFQHLTSLFDENKKWAPKPSGKPDVVIECDDVILAIGQNTAFPFIERDLGLEFDKNDRPVVDKTTLRSTHAQVYFGGDAAFGPKNIIWAVAQAHEAAISIHLSLSGKDLVKDRPKTEMRLVSQKMGVHEWTYTNDYVALQRVNVPHLPLKERFENLKKEVELGFDVKQAADEARRCLNCDVQTVFEEKLCIECDACVDICPMFCLTMTPPAEDLKDQLSAPVLHFPEQALFLSDPLKDTARLMVKDEDLCLHCGLCAERCPTGAWDMQKAVLEIPKASGCSK